MHDSLCKLANVCFEGQIEEAHIFELVDIVSVIVMRAEVIPQVEGSLDLSESVIVSVVPLNIMHETVSVTADVTLGLFYQQVQIIRRMHPFKNLKVILKIGNGFRLIPRLCSDLPLIRCQPLLVNIILR